MERHSVEIFAGDRIQAEKTDKGWRISGVMCSSCRRQISDLRQKHGMKLEHWPIPSGLDHSSMLLRELLLKVRGAWQLPFPHLEICHCRAVPTEVVDQAILRGARTPEEVSAITTATTACGTCRPDVINLLFYRSGHPEEVLTAP